jgi:hypothetical protein
MGDIGREIQILVPKWDLLSIISSARAPPLRYRENGKQDPGQRRITPHS